MRRLIVTLMAIGLAPGAALAEDPPVSGEHAASYADTIGCLEKDDLARVVRLVNDKDGEALKKFLLSRFPACIVVKKGETFTVDDVSVWNGALCARPRGEPECYWIVMGFAKKASD